MRFIFTCVAVALSQLAERSHEESFSWGVRVPVENGTPEARDRSRSFDDVVGPSLPFISPFPDGELHLTALVSCFGRNFKEVWLGGETSPAVEPTMPCSGWYIEDRPTGYALKRVFCSDRDDVFLGYTGRQLVFRHSPKDELTLLLFTEDSHYTFFASGLNLWLAVECSIPVLRPTATKFKLEAVNTEKSKPVKVTWPYVDTIRKFFRDALQKLSEWWRQTVQCVGAFFHKMGPGVLVVALLGLLLAVTICVKCARKHDDSRQFNEA
ncbi:MAG: hypothetical protein KVP17_004058 [Porospora cf. gigantea B]|uniref:uncharacterized protein n=1 Tax=Porospora cf. gigantea B TaxID=2853592 RepID=UPI0035719411|nr:MAG: hypothetical protein KVP17_004058 [Porospora cf. gigantea B]